MTWANAVTTTLKNAITANATYFDINPAAAPFNNPPSDGGKLVLTDSHTVGDKTKFEVISYTSTSSYAGYIRVSGVTRGIDNTTAQPFVSDSIVSQNMTAAELNKLDDFLLSPTPTISVTGNKATITNYTSFLNPFVTVGFNGATGTYTQNNGELTFSNVSLNNRKIGISVASQGSLAKTYMANLELSAFRYYRVSGLTYTGSASPMLQNLRFSAGSSVYPGNMTSNSAPTPYQAQASHFYPGYPAYLAVDSNTVGSGWWLLGHSSSVPTAYLDLDMGSAIVITGLTFRFGSYWSPTIKIEGSNTSPFGGGSGFTGEQTLIYEKAGIAGNTTYYV